MAQHLAEAAFGEMRLIVGVVESAIVIEAATAIWRWA
jgi:hypothetical protein